MRIILATAALLALSGCGQPEARAPIEVVDPIVTLPVLPGRPGGAYFTLKSNSGPARLTGISSESADRIEMHGDAKSGGMSGMRPIEAADVPAGGELKFEPGRRHAMLFGLDPALKPGDEVKLVFNFDGAPPLTVEAPVRAAGDHNGH